MTKRFNPGWGLTLLMITLISVFVVLGHWQWQRKAEKSELFEQFDSAPALPLSVALDDPRPFVRVRVRGRLDTERHVLLDNRIHNGRAGLHVLTPLHSEAGPTLLVNRGWLPMPPDRLSLPAFETPSQPVEISGLLAEPPGTGPRLGEPPAYDIGQWPLLLTWYDATVVNEALGRPLPTRILLMDSDHEAGFADREWAPAVMPPNTHAAYAFQWFSLALAALIIWLILGIKRAA